MWSTALFGRESWTNSEEGKRRLSVFEAIKGRSRLIGHIHRHDGLVKKVIEGQVEEKTAQTFNTFIVSVFTQNTNMHGYFL